MWHSSSSSKLIIIVSQLLSNADSSLFSYFSSTPQKPRQVQPSISHQVADDGVSFTSREKRSTVNLTDLWDREPPAIPKEVLAIFQLIDPVPEETENSDEPFNGPSWRRANSALEYTAQNKMKPEMMQTLKEYIHETYRKNPNSLPTATARSAASEPVYFNLNDVYNYACYCNFGLNWSKGQGKPKNIIDQTCFNVFQCYTCIVKDLEEQARNGEITQDEADSCEPGIQDYTIPPRVHTDSMGFRDACIIANPGDFCASRTCACEVKFIDKLLQFYTDKMVFDPTMKHILGFDVDSECPTCQGDFCDRSPRECCGEYPERFLYKPSLQKGCCVKKTYDINFYGCCDGELAPKGTC